MNVTGTEFKSKVLDASFTKPVLVDFWAPWCAPCRALTPTLEKLETEFQGKFILAKINTEEEKEIAAQFRIMSIPDVRLFIKGEVADQFRGALPESQVRDFLDKYIPSEEIILAHKLIQQGDAEKAADILRKVQNPKKTEAMWWEIASLHAAAESKDKMLSAIGQIPALGGKFSIRREATENLFAKYASPEQQRAHLKLMAHQQDENIAREILAQAVSAVETATDKAEAKALPVLYFQILGDAHAVVIEQRKILARLLY